MSRLLPDRIPTFQELKEARHTCSIKDEEEFFAVLNPYMERLIRGIDPQIGIMLPWDIRDYHISLYITWLYPENPGFGELNGLFIKLAECLEIVHSAIVLNNYVEYSDVAYSGKWIGFTYKGGARSSNIWRTILYCFTLDVHLLPNDLKELIGVNPKSFDIGVGMIHQSRSQDIE